MKSQHFLKVLEPLFEKGAENVDWAKAEEQLQQVFSQMFSSSDFEQYTSQDETSVFVLAKESQNNTPLGVIQFLVTPQFPNGTIKSAYFGVDPSA